MVDMDDDLPADYDYCVTVIGQPPLTTFALTYDGRHRQHGLPHILWVPLIIVFAQWANLQGHQQKYDPSFIDKIKKTAGEGLVINNDREYTPMSTLTGHWVFPITREFDLPYIKRTYASNSTSQSLKKWPDWVSGRIDELEGECCLSAQFQHFGGTNSRFRQNGVNSPTSFSWRDTNITCTIDAFYHGDRQHELARKWQQGNDEGVGKPDAPFCEFDHRVLWGSHDLDLSAAREYYYDNQPEGKYERLTKIKQKYDPSGVFTANRFCIGLPPLPEGMQPETKPVVSKEGEVIEEPKLSAEERFWNLVRMELEPGKPVPVWHFWHT
jgi:hypothetical protein